MIAILDYGIGNLASIRNMFKHVGTDAIVTSDPQAVDDARALVLPGIGAFDACLDAFRAARFFDAVNRNVTDAGKPILGICVGMQMMGRGSEEGTRPGLSWIAGDVRRLQPSRSSGLKVPHLGWADIETNSKCPLFRDQSTEPRFYFAHSFHLVCDNAANVAASYDFDGKITCAVWSGSRYGVQFHPEKSHSHGVRLFESFRSLVGEPSTRPDYDAV